MGRVPGMRAQSAFGFQSMWGNSASEQRQEDGFARRNLMADFRSPGPSSLKGPLANSGKPSTLICSCCVESNFCSVRFAEYLSTGVPGYSFIRASGNSERRKMTGQNDNDGFLGTGSGVQQFQLSLRGCLVLQRRHSSSPPAAPTASGRVPPSLAPRRFPPSPDYSHLQAHRKD
jgi:hypothetical protein